MVRIFWLSALVWGVPLLPLGAQPEAPVPAFVQTPPAQTFFQLGAFRTESNAQSLVRGLLRQGYQPRLRQEGSVFRVYLVCLENEAPALAARLGKDGRNGFLQISREPEGTELKLSTE